MRVAINVDLHLVLVRWLPRCHTKVWHSRLCHPTQKLAQSLRSSTEYNCVGAWYSNGTSSQRLHQMVQQVIENKVAHSLSHSLLVLTLTNPLSPVGKTKAWPIHQASIPKPQELCGYFGGHGYITSSFPRLRRSHKLDEAMQQRYRRSLVNNLPMQRLTIWTRKSYV